MSLTRADPRSVDFLYGLADTIVRFMDSGPPLLLALLYLTIVGVPATLAHELGHAIAARRLLGAEVGITVGSTAKMVEMRLGEISVSLNALAHPARVAGSAMFNASRATARDVLLIALAGPAASIVGKLITAWALSRVAPAGLAHDLFWAATLAGGFGVLELVPLTLQERRRGPSIRTDGRLALDALRAARAARP